MKSLIIIDMQPYFAHRYGHTLKSYKHRINNIINAIKLAKKNKWNIILVEYKSSWLNQKTALKIRKELGNYKYKILYKNGNSAMPAIRNYFTKKGFGSHTLIITGANSDACVCDTIYDLYTQTCHKVYAYTKGIMSFNVKKYKSYKNSTAFMKQYYKCSLIDSLKYLTK